MKLKQDELLERFRHAFPEASIELVDESHLYMGHANGEDDTEHFSVKVVDAKFNQLQNIERHQLVYDAVSDSMHQPVDALNIIAMTPDEATRVVTKWKSWICLLCGWIYEEGSGLPDDGIPPGTRWEDVPLDWTCPECGASKDVFDMVEV
jgi:rubredoxin/stress-induced morphogen